MEGNYTVCITAITKEASTATDVAALPTLPIPRTGLPTPPLTSTSASPFIMLVSVIFLMEPKTGREGKIDGKFT